MPEFERQKNPNRNGFLARSAGRDRSIPKPVHDNNHLLAQHQALGNQAMQRFAQSCPLTLPSASLCPTGGACHTCPATVQTKLKINEPGDKYEQEADRVAEQVMRMPEPKVAEEKSGSGQAQGPRIQRICTECEEELHRQPIEEEEEEEEMQAKPLSEQITPLIQRQVEEEEEEEELQAKPVSGQTPHVSSRLQAQIGALRGDGQPLPQSVRSFFEPCFGHDLSQVRVHTGARAVESAAAVKARAFTIGCDIVFGKSQYSTETADGKQLLAHELTHVIQQENGAVGKIQRKGKRKDAFGKECPDTVVLEKAIPTPFTKELFDAGYRTYLRLNTTMKVGPKDRYESCITEVLKVVENTCGKKGNLASYIPCTPKKYCLPVGGTKKFPASPNTFIDMHRSRRKFNLLQGSGKKDCKVKCLQRYGCGGKEIGRFYITRNFKADVFNDGTSKVPITVGTIKKETA